MIQPRPFSHAERRDWLMLARAENVGPISFKHLMKRYGSASEALEALPEIAARGGRKSFKPPSLDNAEREIALHEDFGAKLIASCEPDYPTYLAAIEDAPPIISVRGNIAALHKKCLGIVGARNASLNGRKLAEIIARDLGKAGYIVVSGLARGIDTAAHKGSVETGAVAVLAGGVDNIYPPENAGLYEQISENGCIVAEMPFGSEPRAQHFPRRNRIISGLSLGVAVIEAALQSGSLITARMALEQGREVFAVPGSPLDPRAGGTNRLLKQGATLIQNAEEIIEALPMGFAFADSAKNDNFTPLPATDTIKQTDNIRLQIIDNISTSPTEVDELIRECHVSAPLVLTVLLELELAGKIQRMAGNRVCLAG